MLDVDAPISQAAFGALVGVSEARVSQMVAAGQLAPGATGRQWLGQYLARVRGYNGSQATDAAREALLQARARHQQLRTAQLARELVDVGFLQLLLAETARRMAAILDAVPVRIRRELPAADPDLIALVVEQISAARLEAAALELPLEQLLAQHRERMP